MEGDPRAMQVSARKLNSQIVMTFKALLALAAALTLGFTTAIAKDEDTPLTKEMTAMNKSLRMLKRQVADPAKKQDNLALVAKMKVDDPRAPSQNAGNH